MSLVEVNAVTDKDQNAMFSVFCQDTEISTHLSVGKKKNKQPNNNNNNKIRYVKNKGFENRKPCIDYSALHIFYM